MINTKELIEDFLTLGYTLKDALQLAKEEFIKRKAAEKMSKAIQNAKYRKQVKINLAY